MMIITIKGMKYIAKLLIPILFVSKLKVVLSLKVKR